MLQPDVSVIVPVWNAMPYLVTCLSSLMEQTIDRARMEVIAVDDGSTDGSGEQLDLVAASWRTLQVVHQPASAGPSRPRNVALDRASGRYVFFLDADDYLGAEALERMVALADAGGADLVTGRRQGIGGREVQFPLAPRPRHDGLDTGAYDAIARRARDANDWAPRLTAFSDCKHLFRRDRIIELGLRFDESLKWSEDTVFSAKYVAASTVDMVTDYDCYYYRLRDDGNNLTTMLAGTESHVRSVEVGLWLQEEHDELRWRRDQHVRDAVVEITDQVFGERFLLQEPAVRQRLVDRARALLARWLTPRSVARLPALGRLKVHLVGQGREPELSELIRVVAAGGRGRDVVRDGRVYAGYPYFRDPAVGIPDDCYDVTGELEVRHHLSALAWAGPRLLLAGRAHIEHVDTVEVTTQLVLRDRLGRSERQWPVRPVPTPGLTEECGLGRYHYDLAGFEVEVDCAGGPGERPLAPGKWGAFLAVGAQGVTKEAPLGGSRAASLDCPLETPVMVPAGSQSAVGISAFFTKYGTLTLDVGG